MKAVFADSYYFFALLNPRDAAHGAAREFSQTYEGLIVTTAWCLRKWVTGFQPRAIEPYSLGSWIALTAIRFAN